MEEKRFNEVAEALQKKVKNPCPMCGGNNLTVIDETSIPINSNPNAVVIGGPQIPVILLGCDTCGYVMSFAQSVLGVARNQEGAKND